MVVRRLAVAVDLFFVPVAFELELDRPCRPVLAFIPLEAEVFFVVALPGVARDDASVLVFLLLLALLGVRLAVWRVFAFVGIISFPAHSGAFHAAVRLNTNTVPYSWMRRFARQDRNCCR